MPVPSELHVDSALTNLAVQYSPREFNMVSDIILPRLGVEKKSNKYFIYVKADRFTVPDTRRAPKSPANQVDFGVSTGTYSCENYALGDFVAQAEEDNADSPLSPQADAVEGILDLMMLDREKRATDLVTATANITQNTTLSGNAQWSDYGNSNPLSDVETGKSACFYPPNLMVLGQAVYDKLKYHPDLQEMVKYSERAVLTEEVMASLFGVERVVVARAKRNTAAEGQAAAYANIWGKDVLLAYVRAGKPNPKAISLGYTPVWTPMGGADGFRVRKWDKPEIGGGGTQIEVDTSMDELLVAADVAYLIKNAIA